jgi:mRNA interferase RelE/StbE
MSGREEHGWSVSYERRAEKDIARLDPQVRKRVLARLGDVARDPYAASLRQLTGRAGGAESRLRIGDWRALLKLDEATRTIRVQRVLPRGRAYDR